MVSIDGGWTPAGVGDLAIWRKPEERDG